MLLTLASPASAFIVTSVGVAGGNPGDLCAIEGGTTCQPYFEVSGLLAGDSFDMVWDLDGSQILGPDGVPDFPTISATGTLSVASITTTTVVLDITLQNTTNPADNTGCSVGTLCPTFEAGIIAFGMLMDGYTSGALSTAGTSLDTYDTNNIAGGPGLHVDFCASTDASCNTGVTADGIQIGGSDALQFTLTGTFDPVGGITLANFATKWQTNYDTIVIPDNPLVTAGNSSFELPSLPALVMPEPSSLSLLGLGIAALAWQRRRKP